MTKTDILYYLLNCPTGYMHRAGTDPETRDALDSLAAAGAVDLTGPWVSIRSVDAARAAPLS